LPIFTGRGGDRAKGAHLFVARTTTADARALLEDASVSVIDSRGNLRVMLPGLFVWVDGRDEPSRDDRPEPPVSLAGRAGLAAQALMHSPERLWKVYDLATEANVSVGLAHRVFKRLEREQLVEVQGVGPQRTRRVSKPTALLDLWTEEMHDRGVKQARAFRLARDPRVLASTLSSALADAKIDHAVTGAAAAIRLAPFVTAIPVTDIWVTETAGLEAVADAVQADTVKEGHNIVFRHASGDTPLAFRQRVDDVWLANPFRLFYDLRQDPRRGREQADHLRKDVIGF